MRFSSRAILPFAEVNFMALATRLTVICCTLFFEKGILSDSEETEWICIEKSMFLLTAWGAYNFSSFCLNTERFNASLPFLNVLSEFFTSTVNMSFTISTKEFPLCSIRFENSFTSSIRLLLAISLITFAKPIMPLIGPHISCAAFFCFSAATLTSLLSFSITFIAINLLTISLAIIFNNSIFSGLSSFPFLSNTHNAPRLWPSSVLIGTPK